MIVRDRQRLRCWCRQRQKVVRHLAPEDAEQYLSVRPICSFRLRRRLRVHPERLRQLLPRPERRHLGYELLRRG